MLSKRSLELFQKASREIPAYKKFLHDQGVKSGDIKTVADMSKLPLTNKKNYLVPNSIEDLVWPQDQQGLMLFCSTSGSTGEPYYFARNDQLSWQYSFLIEDYLNQSSYGQGKTLVINGFGMGVWIGGIITHRAFEIAAERMKKPVAILPVGNFKKEIFKALKKLSPHFDQTILIGYPPLMKEIIDEAEGQGFDLKKLNMRLLFAAEAFTETFRNYVCEKAGVKDPIRDTLNIYGTADIGAMAYETALSILVRRLAIENPELYMEMFGQLDKTPTLTQYNPEFVEYEVVDGKVVLSGNNSMPLVRYDVGDNGGVLEYEEAERLLDMYDIDLGDEVKKAGISKFVKKTPFVFVYERTDLSASLYGINIYPEFVKEGLLTSETAKFFTEKFTMSTKTDVHHNQFLQINVELQKDVKPSKNLEEMALETVKQSLKAKSSEFADMSQSRDVSKMLQIVLWENGHPRYFKPGTKQKWVAKI